MHVKRLPAAHQSTIDAVAVFFVEKLGADRPIQWYRHAFVKLCRKVDVAGASFASLTMKTPDAVVVGLARVLTYIGDPVHGQQLVNEVVEELNQEAIQTGAHNPPPIPMTPIRNTSRSPEPVHDMHQEQKDGSSSSSPERTLFPPPRDASSSLSRPQEDATPPSEEEKRTIFSSARAKNFEALANVLLLLAAMPVYTWPKKSKHHGDLTRALILVAQEYAIASKDPIAFVSGIGQRLRQARVTLSSTDASTLQILTATILDAPPTRSALTGIAEIAALAQMPKATIQLLRLCRVAAAPVDNDEFDRWTNGKADLPMGGISHLATVPVRAEGTHSRRNSPSPRPRPKHANPATPRDTSPAKQTQLSPTKQDGSSPKTCKYCGESVTVPWRQHLKVCPDF